METKNCNNCRHEISSVCLDCDKETLSGWESKRSILNDNIAFAFFMGHKDIGAHRTDKYGYHQCEMGFKIEFDNPNNHPEDDRYTWAAVDLRYNVSWDWLVPVVKKLQKEAMELDYELFEIHSAALNQGLLTLDISLVWEETAKILEWFNKKKGIINE